MKIYYIANFRIPTEKAHGYQVVKTCEGMAKNGQIVELIIPNRKNNIKENIFGYYQVSPIFSVKKLGGLDFLKIDRFLFGFGYWLQSLNFLLSLIFLGFPKGTVIYTRNSEIAWLFSVKGYKTVFEAHNWPRSKNWLYKFFLERNSLIICNSQGTAAEHKKFFNEAKILVVPNGVDLEKFPEDKGSDYFKQKTGLPENKKVVMYMGHLYEWKGAWTLLETAEKLKNRDDLLFVFVGGEDKERRRYLGEKDKKSINNVLFLPHQKQSTVADYLMSADVLVLPNKPIGESEKFTSPIKMFEYMATASETC
jgi:glycosyltransferase involved in cell wall biosynthesis